MTATFKVSAFGDEIGPDLEEQLTVLDGLNVKYLDLRGAWGNNVVNMDDADLAKVNALLKAHGTQVACLGSPIGKSPILDPIDLELNNLRKIMHVGETVNCRSVRMFSFYPPDTSTNVGYDEYIDLSVERLKALAELAGSKGFTLYLENEKGIVTDTLARSEVVVKAVNSPHLQFLWDSANFVQVGEARVVERGWPMVGAEIGFVHIKDAVLADGHVVPSGEGDGQIPLLLTKLKESGYQGFITLEPHLKIAGHSTGHSGADGMTLAANALRKVMADTGCKEIW